MVCIHRQEMEEAGQADARLQLSKGESTKMKAPWLLTSLKFLPKFWALNETKRR